jgi:predicted permease
VVLVLTIACANVANLELARAQSRRREGALRAALGASRGRLIRQHLVESATLAALGGAAGLALAVGGLKLVVAAAPAGIPRLDEVALDGRVLLFGLAASAATTLACGLLPALRASRVDPAAELRGAAGGIADQVEAGFRRPALIALEVALAVILAIGAGLLARTLWNLGRVDPGYRVDSILALDLAPPATAYPGGAQLDDFFRRVRSGIEALPGIERAGAVSHLPLGSSRGDWNFYPEDRPLDPRSPAPRGDWQVATPGYFETLGIAVVDGRGLAESDDAKAPLVLVVNQALARRYWANRSPVGVRVRLGGNDANPYATIAGVVADVRHAALDREPVPELYLPLAQAASILGRGEPRELTVTVRTAGDPAAATAAIRALVARLDPDLPVANVRTLAQVRARSLALTRFATLALGGFAALALALGAVGVFGVISYLTLGRRRELGIRMALGAERRGIFALVVGQGVRPALVGVGVGVGAALGLTRLLDALLFEVEPADAVTYAAVAGLFLAVAVLACWAPARRASRIDPAAVLRE